MGLKTEKQSKASWGQLKTKLGSLDRSGLIDLIHDLYSASDKNRSFLHARFALGADPLKPYKGEIARWLYPDVYNDRETYSVAKAKAAIVGYRRAVGAPEGLAELMVFFCEQASSFCEEFGMDDDGFYGALVNMFRSALEVVAGLEPQVHDRFMERLEVVRDRAQQFGYGAGDDIAHDWASVIRAAG